MFYSCIPVVCLEPSMLDTTSLESRTWGSQESNPSTCCMRPPLLIARLTLGLTGFKVNAPLCFLHQVILLLVSSLHLKTCILALFLEWEAGS